MSVSKQKKCIWEKIKQNDCRYIFKTDAKSDFFPQTGCSIQKKHDKREPGLFKEDLRCTETKKNRHIQI